MKYKKRYVTLIEMMIVMFLIALITGVIAYNYRGTLEEGKAFKTKTGMEKLDTILNLKAAEDPKSLDSMASNWKEYVRQSPLVQNADALITDGWGDEYEVTVENGVIKIRSKAYEEHRRGGKSLLNQN